MDKSSLDLLCNVSRMNRSNLKENNNIENMNVSNLNKKLIKMFKSRLENNKTSESTEDQLLDIAIQLLKIKISK